MTLNKIGNRGIGMTQINFAGYVLAGLVVVAMSPPTASAQSTISGQVRDASGAVMAGVKVEAECHKP